MLKWCLLAGMGLSAVILAQSTVQWVTIMRGFADPERSPDSPGYFYIPTPNTYWSGQLFEAYRELSGDTLSRFVRLRQWTDSFVRHHHYEYQHYFMDIPVVGGIVREHFSDEGLYLLHGKIGWFDGVDTIDWRKLLDPQTAVYMFLRTHFSFPDDTAYYFAWEDSLWEAYLKSELEDSTATWFPQARLVWITPDLGNVHGPYLKKLRLAYAIHVFCLEPLLNRTYYVDAFRPWEILFVTDHIHCFSCPSGYGTATVLLYGNRCIDTRKKGNRYILWADDNGHNIHTKKYFPLAQLTWAIAGNYKDKDNQWGTSHQRATSTHWYAQVTWDFLASRLGISLPYYVRISVPKPWNGDIRNIEDYTSGFLMMIVGDRSTGALDLIAHEIAHYALHYTSSIEARGESGALKEGMADIIAYSVERWIEGSGADWLIGEDAIPGMNPLNLRNMENPAWGGYNFADTNDCESIVGGQPDTYYGYNWYPPTGPCDYGGIHVNSGVLNFWFYLLNEGGTGVNDHGHNYNIAPIGHLEALYIATYAWTHFIDASPGFYDFAEATIAAEKVLYNYCWIERELREAWNAVGVYVDPNPLPDCIPTGLFSATLKTSRYTHIIWNWRTRQLVIYPVEPSWFIRHVQLFTIEGKILAQTICRDYPCVLPVHSVPQNLLLLIIRYDQPDLPAETFRLSLIPSSQ